MDHGIELAPMHQLSESRGPDDNWTGITDKAERRRRQCRLNSRAYRNRRVLQDKYSMSRTQPVVRQPQFTSIPEQSDANVGHGAACQIIRRRQVSGQRASSPTCVVAMAAEFAPFRLDGSVVLPLSSDHLIPLLQFNAFRATLTNVIILSVAHLIPPRCDITEALRVTPLFNIPSIPPPSLRPTALQQSVPHETWIDLLPDPIMRDNAIRSMHTFSAEDICGDMLGHVGQGRNTVEMTGVLVWGDPWEVDSWELTEGFLTRWGFLLKGCHNALAATNYWRTRRGDEPLVFEIQ